jgi:4-methyl-5(b-hydroxyethyl)-thiazole monophosphate biosynthesis
MAKQALVFLADGFEEVEAITPIDYLRRAGVEVTTSAIFSAMNGEKQVVKGAHGIEINADTYLFEQAISGQLNIENWDAIVLPGGTEGARNLAESDELIEMIRKMLYAGKLVCVICASPAVVLAPNGFLRDRRFTCYPGFEAKVKDGQWSDERVVIDRSLITSRGPGTAADWALAIIGELVSKEAAQEIAAQVLLQG